jgi:soluble lytic murein transglycosylase-like protein
MNIEQTYRKILQEESLDEGIVKNAVGAVLIAGAALGAHKMLQPPTDNPMRVVSGAVTKFEKQPMTQDESASHIANKWNVNPNTAKQIAVSAFRHGSADGSFPTPHHVLGLIATESSFNPAAKSKLKADAAIGLTQIRPKTSGVDKKELSTIDGQIKHSVAILKDFHHRSNGDIEMALNSYNNGFRAVYNDRPGINKAYAQKVISASDKFHK